MQLFKSQMKEDVEMNDKTEIKTDKISYKKYYRQMGILGTLGGAMWIFYWVMEKVLPAIKKGHTYQCDKPYRIFGNACADRRMHNKDDIHGRQKRYK